MSADGSCDHAAEQRACAPGDERRHAEDGDLGPADPHPECGRRYFAVAHRGQGAARPTATDGDNPHRQQRKHDGAPDRESGVRSGGDAKDRRPPDEVTAQPEHTRVAENDVPADERYTKGQECQVQTAQPSGGERHEHAESCGDQPAEEHPQNAVSAERRAGDVRANADEEVLRQGQLP